ncbi:MAG: 30S ribosomal protein S2 [SAR324 cluster bacterium]|nr:30S ribosomal protein S2 [SAR324 cluster bacterium]
MADIISLKSFLEAGVHLGHQTRRWHPQMKPYIYAAKQGIHIVDLRKTLHSLKDAYEYVKHASAEGRDVLFVGTKPQIQKVVEQQAISSNSPYISFRWLGGMLTNFTTVRQSINRYHEYEELRGSDGTYPGVLKKEALVMESKRLKLEKSLGGVKNMKRPPSIMFVVDCKKEHIAIQEAKKLGMTIIALVDTNCAPGHIDFVIPGNDDAPRSVELITSVIARAVKEGKAMRAAATGISEIEQEIPAEPALPEPENVETEIESESEDE